MVETMRPHTRRDSRSGKQDSGFTSGPGTRRSGKANDPHAGGAASTVAAAMPLPAGRPGPPRMISHGIMRADRCQKGRRAPSTGRRPRFGAWVSRVNDAGGLDDAGISGEKRSAPLRAASQASSSAASLSRACSSTAFGCGSRGAPRPSPAAQMDTLALRGNARFRSAAGVCEMTCTSADEFDARSPPKKNRRERGRCAGLGGQLPLA